MDPIGACVGPKGQRVAAIVDELRGEKIDIIKWSEDPAEFIAAAGQTVTWEDFEAAMAEWVVDLEAAKAAQKERKRQKAVKKRESRRCKKKEAARRGEESLAEIEAQWVATYKAGKENIGVWPACPDGSM